MVLTITADNNANLRIVFIRHNMSRAKRILPELMKRKLIAIHYENISSTNPDDYKEPTAKRTVARLNDYCKTGAIVCADFTMDGENNMLIGKIKSNTKIKSKKFGKYIYKTVQLHEVRQISLQRYPMLLARRPRQQTLTGWKINRNLLEAIWKRKKIPIEVSSLDPNLLEVICYEYLKKKKILNVLLMPIGRTMKDVDILGMNRKGKKVIAQVTHNTNSREIKKKIEKLRKWGSNDELLFFFGPKEVRVNDSKIKYISIKKVFQSLIRNPHTIHYKMIKSMLD